MSGSLKWRGDELIRKVQEAQVYGVNATMAQCVEQAKNNHAWNNQTGTLEGSIAIAEYATREGSGVVGTWGSRDVRYARIHELGGVIVPVRAKALKFKLPDGSFRVVESVRIPARPFLRPAADAIYPKLKDNIRKALERTFSKDGGLQDAAREILNPKPTSGD